jgi:hypothetical protein
MLLAVTLKEMKDEQLDSTCSLQNKGLLLNMAQERAIAMAEGCHSMRRRLLILFRWQQTRLIHNPKRSGHFLRGWDGGAEEPREGTKAL